MSQDKKLTRYILYSFKILPCNYIFFFKGAVIDRVFIYLYRAHKRLVTALGGGGGSKNEKLGPWSKLNQILYT